MGMFDRMRTEPGTEWQTKAFENELNTYSIGDTLPGPPFDYQVEIFGGRVKPAEYRESCATVKAGRLAAIDVPRDSALPLMDYDGYWTNPAKD